MSDLPETIWVIEDESSGDESASIMADLYCAYEKGVLVGNPEQFTRTDTIPTWNTDMEAAPDDVAVFIAFDEPFFGKMTKDVSIGYLDSESRKWMFDANFIGVAKEVLRVTHWKPIKPPTP